ncbi:MAG TPA: aminotransferase class V-fold PLP-dependent enzyme [Candidatus Dormibacteraeota bacterium]
MIDAEEFPITRDRIYFDHATFGPPPRRYVQAAADFTSRMSEEGLPDLFSLSQEGVDGVRDKAARLFGCSPEQVAFIRATSHGVNLVAEGLSWREGDEVVIYELDHPSGVMPWLNLRDRGVRVRIVEDRGRQGFEAADVEALLGPRTRAVSLSLVNFAHGGRADIEAVAELCRARGIWLVVDAIQALGALRVDPAALGAHVVAAHGYKWLLSGFGLGLCYLSERALAELKVGQLGWKSIRDPFNVERVLDFRMEMAPGARRFEPSFPPLPQLFAMGAVLDLLLEVGPAAIEGRVLALVRRLVAGLQECDYEVVGAQGESPRTPIVSVVADDRFREACAALKVVCATREGRARLSPHFYNTEAEVDALLGALAVKIRK